MQLWWASSEQLVMWQLVSETSLPWSFATERPTLCIKISFRNSPTDQRGPGQVERAYAIAKHRVRSKGVLNRARA